MERRVTVEFGPSRSKRFAKAVAEAQSGPGQCQELEPGRYLLDGAKAGGWRLFSATTGNQIRRLPRLGGRPLWCCPVNAYDALGQRSQ
jgi:hypothetical protein